jgi:toxin ParE1/3/4
MTYKLTLEAEDDVLRLLVQGQQTFGPKQVQTYYEQLVDCFEFLAQFPKAARERPEIDPPVRVHPFVSHLIIYREIGEDILIVSIRHGHEDWIAQLADDAADD